MRHRADPEGGGGRGERDPRKKEGVNSATGDRSRKSRTGMRTGPFFWLGDKEKDSEGDI